MCIPCCYATQHMDAAWSIPKSRATLASQNVQSIFEVIVKLTGGLFAIAIADNPQVEIYLYCCAFHATTVYYYSMEESPAAKPYQVKIYIYSCLSRSCLNFTNYWLYYGLCRK